VFAPSAVTACGRTAPHNKAELTAENQRFDEVHLISYR